MILARNVAPGNLFLADNQAPSTASGPYSGNTILCLPFSRLLRTDALVYESMTSNGHARAGLYSAGQDGRSGDLIEDLGEQVQVAGQIVFPFTAPRFLDSALTLAIMFDGSTVCRLASMSSARCGELFGYNTLNTLSVVNFNGGFEMFRTYADGLPRSLKVDNILGITAVPALALRSII